MYFKQSINPSVLQLKLKINDIPCLLFKPNNLNRHYKTIIFYHGWHSSKEDVAFRAILLSSFGYLVVVPDAIYHGERDPIDYDKEGMLDKYFWKIVLNTIDESEDFIQEVKQLNLVDENNIVLMGSSMGGFSASGIFMKNSIVKSLVVINGVSAFLYAEDFFGKSSENKKQLASYDLSMHLDKINNRQILMLHGIKDETIPIEIQRYFYEKALPHYKNPGNIELKEYLHVNHHITTSMLEDIISFLKK